MSDTVPIFEAKNKLPFYVHKAETEGPVRLSRRNKEVAIIISAGEYEDMVDQLKSFMKGKSIVERLQDFKKKYADIYAECDLGMELESAISARNHNKSEWHKDHNVWEGILDD